MIAGHFETKITGVKGILGMEKCSKFIVKYRNWILLVATILLIPALWGYFNTRVNYDILTYLPRTARPSSLRII